MKGLFLIVSAAEILVHLMMRIIFVISNSHNLNDECLLPYFSSDKAHSKTLVRSYAENLKHGKACGVVLFLIRHVKFGAAYT